MVHVEVGLFLLKISKSHPRQPMEKVFGPDNLFGSQSLKNSFSTKRKHAFSG